MYFFTKEDSDELLGSSHPAQKRKKTLSGYFLVL